eukprot:TRINITY_DN14544_c0_g1_i2.p1 TRINITY_DN14544_c0_g1~~TRINITY_DN14544_c0_g1_i2.p1  ORF type:complete len:169 (+),score=23.24 TRINITY_DN14544_c0_g1_i2:105-611(+)
MVFYFTSRGPESYTIYMGKDKFENEDLIAFGFPEDIWFHVDNISSAHVYLRLPINQTIDDIPEGILEDCLQLVKFNSITGCKQSTVDVVFTPWSNLKKTNGMETGQVGFHDEKLVKKFKNVRKEASVLNRLLKTKREEFPDLKRIYNLLTFPLYALTCTIIALRTVPS